MLDLRQQLKTASVSSKGGEKESDRLKKELDKARQDLEQVLLAVLLPMRNLTQLSIACSECSCIVTVLLAMAVGSN